MDMFTMFRTNMAAGGEGIPDIYESNATDIPEFSERGLTLPIDDFMATTKADLIPAALKVASYNGKIWGVPMQVKTKVWWYRKDMFEKAGIKPEEVKTVDDLISAGKALRGVYPDASLFNLGPKSSGGWLSMLLTYYEDLKFAEKGGTWNVTTDERFAQLFDVVKKIYKADITSPVGDWSSDWSPALTDSKIASIIGPSGASWMAEFLPQFDTKHSGQWGAALWPEFSRYGSESGGSVWAITKFSKHPDVAFEYLKNFLLTPKGAVVLYKLIGFLPMIASAKDLVKQEATKNERPAGTTDEQWKMAPVNYFGLEYLDMLFKSQEVVRIFSYDMAYGNEMNILGQYCDQYVEGTLTLPEALKAAESEMKTQIVDPYKLG
jgi:ABC-type glycerol-3-phosphate transport system substrate-binding protein